MVVQPPQPLLHVVPRRCCCSLRQLTRLAAVVTFVVSLLTVVMMHITYLGGENDNYYKSVNNNNINNNNNWIGSVLKQYQEYNGGGGGGGPTTKSAIKQQQKKLLLASSSLSSYSTQDHSSSITEKKSIEVGKQAIISNPRKKSKSQQQQHHDVNDNNNNDNNNNGYREPLDELLLLDDGEIAKDKDNHNNLLPLPIQVMEQYKKWHSVDALRSNPHGRQYALGFYSCPYSAGNRLHEFFNDLLFSILLNRTLLWKYPDSNTTCRQYGLRCEIVNSVTDCDQMLVRAPWIPSYDEFASQLGLDKLKPRVLPAVRSFDSLRKQAMRKNKNLKNVSSNDFYKGQYKHLSAVGPYNKSPVQLAVYGRDFLDIDWLDDEDRFKLHNNEYAINQAKKLYDFGKAFLYGMIHRYSFDFSKRIQDSLPKISHVNNNNNNNKAPYTVAMHSRHPYDNRLPECDISRETKCVKQLLQQKKLFYKRKEHTINKVTGAAAAAAAPCIAFVLTDRECTIDKMREWIITNTPCDVRIAPHEKGVGSRGEHGPFAGAGYFQDLAFASGGARHAMVASGGFARLLRTSSMTLFELIEYHRIIEKWKLEGHRDYTKMGNVSLCILPM